MEQQEIMNKELEEKVINTNEMDNCRKNKKARREDTIYDG